MKKVTFFLVLLTFLIGTVSAVQFCKTYDSFNKQKLNLNKWEIRSDVEGQPFMDEYFVDLRLKNFHTKQNAIGDRRVYLFPKRTFTTGDSIKYDVALLSKEGNHMQMVLLTGDQYIRIGILGYSDGIQGFDDLGVAHIELQFQENNLRVIRFSPLGQTFVDDLLLNNPNGTYELYIGSVSGHNGLVHLDYDNFKTCKEANISPSLM